MESPRLIGGLGANRARCRHHRRSGAGCIKTRYSAMAQSRACRTMGQPGSWRRRASPFIESFPPGCSRLKRAEHEELGREFAEKELAVPDFDSALMKCGRRCFGCSSFPVIRCSRPMRRWRTRFAGLGADNRQFHGRFCYPKRRSRDNRALETDARGKKVPFEVPRGEGLAARLSSVLSVIYLIFNEGYSATAGDDWMRPTCVKRRCDWPFWRNCTLGAQVHGLVALMEIQASRSKAGVGPAGEPVCCFRTAQIGTSCYRRGLAALNGRRHCARATCCREPGRYELQAAIAACHARARTRKKQIGRGLCSCMRRWPKLRGRW